MSVIAKGNLIRARSSNFYINFDKYIVSMNKYGLLYEKFDSRDYTTPLINGLKFTVSNIEQM